MAVDLHPTIPLPEPRDHTTRNRVLCGALAALYLGLAYEASILGAITGTAEQIALDGLVVVGLLTGVVAFRRS